MRFDLATICRILPDSYPIELPDLNIVFQLEVLSIEYSVLHFVCNWLLFTGY